MEGLDFADYREWDLDEGIKRSVSDLFTKKRAWCVHPRWVH